MLQFLVYTTIISLSVGAPQYGGVQPSPPVKTAPLTGSVKCRTEYMRIPETWKGALKSLTTSYSYTKQPSPPPTTPTTVHNTPAGQYPQEGPQPGKLGVIFYYASVTLCIMGVLSMARCTVIPVSNIKKPECVSFIHSFFLSFLSNFPQQRKARANVPKS